MGPILSGVMAVHRSTIDHLMGRVSSIMTPETGWIFLRGAEFFGLHHDGSGSLSRVLWFFREVLARPWCYEAGLVLILLHGVGSIVAMMLSGLTV